MKYLDLGKIYMYISLSDQLCNISAKANENARNCQLIDRWQLDMPCNNTCHTFQNGRMKKDNTFQY